MRRICLPLLLLALLTGCRDSPMEVVQKASDAASQGNLVDLQRLFSHTTVSKLEKHWNLTHVAPTEGWQQLAQKLIFEGRPLKVLDENIHGDYALVWATNEVERFDFYLRKDDGRWRIELGAAQRYRRAAQAAAPQDDPAHAAAGKAAGKVKGKLPK